MIPSGIAHRYATALLNSAVAKKIAGEINDEFSALCEIFSKNASLKGFLLSPQVLTKDKRDVLEEIFKGRSTQLFLDFLQLLITKKRFPFVEEIAESYKSQYEKHEGIIEAKLITAVPLDEDTKNKAVQRLEEETNKKIRIVPITDSSIIGGMIIIMEDKIIDGSIRYQLERMKKDLYETRVY
jgi:F-type H+-transporting ATPase subunit delta